MKTDKEKESNWEDYFKQAQKEMGMSDFEKFTLNRINKIIQKVKDPSDRISELNKIKDGIEAATYTSHSWSGKALNRVKSGIQMARDEQKEGNGSLTPVDWHYILEQMDELTKKEGYSDSEAARLVEKEIKGVRKAGTIRNRYGEYKQGNYHK